MHAILEIHCVVQVSKLKFIEVCCNSTLASHYSQSLHYVRPCKVIFLFPIPALCVLLLTHVYFNIEKYLHLVGTGTSFIQISRFGSKAK